MPQLPDDLELYMVNSLDSAQKMMDWLINTPRNVLGLDTETTGLNPYAPGAKLRTIQIGDMHTGWLIPWDGWGGVALQALNYWANRQGEFAVHNLPFDAVWLELHAGWRIPWHLANDTEIMARIAEPNQPAKLKVVCDKYIDPRASEGEKKLKEAFRKNGWFWDTVPITLPEYWIYGALDPVLAAHIYNYFRTDLKYPAVYENEMAICRICTRMQMQGMRIDEEYSEAMYNKYHNEVESGKQWAQDNWGVNIASNDQMGEFYESIGAQFSDELRTKTGARSVAKKQIAMFMKSDNKKVREAAKFVTRIKGLEKMSNTYFYNFMTLNNDGIVHPNIRTLGARTSRMSVTNPALQTVPRGDALIRDAFIPRNAGELLLSCDYSQVEMRLLAHFSGDDKLRKAFEEADATGGDFFVTLGKEIYNDSTFDKKDARRGLVKGTMYGAAYGSGVQTMADTAGVTYEQMQAVRESVFATYPGIKKFMQDIEKVGKQREKDEGVAYVRTQMGRVIPCDEGKVYALTNYILQGTAAELMKMSIIKLDAAGYTDYMCMPIHDEMIFSLPKEEIETSSHEIEELMSYVNGEFAVALPAEPEAGMDRWGSKYRKEGEEFGYSVEEVDYDTPDTSE